MNKDWKDYDIEELKWGDYGFRMVTAMIGAFSICLAITSVYIVSVGYGLASFYLWAFTTNFWIPVSYHTWFILATIPFVNVTLVAIAFVALVLKFSIIYFVMVIIPLIFEGLCAWALNIVDNLVIMLNSGQMNGTEQNMANATIDFLNNVKK